MDALKNEQRDYQMIDDKGWRKITTQARILHYAEWARKTKGLKAYVSGLECVHNVFRLWDIYRLPPDLIPDEDRGYTLNEIVGLLGRVGEVKIWYGEHPLVALGGLEARSQGQSKEKSLDNLLRLEKPALVCLSTDWTIVRHVSRNRGRVTLCDRYHPIMELSEFLRRWDEAANITVLILALKRDVVSHFEWELLIPQHQLEPPGELQDFMNEIEEPPGIEAAINHYARLEPQDTPIKVTEDNLRIIGKTLLSLQDSKAESKWDVIVKGGLPGYEIYIHQLVRVGWCFEQVPPINPCSLIDAIRHYSAEHPLSLIAEHKFLQLVAMGRLWQTLATRSNHSRFTVRELVLANPLSKDTENDWNTILTFDKKGRCFLRKEDLEDRGADKIADAREWYIENGFPKEPEW